MGRLANAFTHSHASTRLVPAWQRNKKTPPRQSQGTRIECPDCSGTGDLDWNGQVIPCPPCDGTGDIPEMDLRF